MNQYIERLQSIQNKMEAQKVDAVLVTSPLSVAYVTGFVCDPHERFMALVINRNGNRILFVPALEKEQAETSLRNIPGIVQEIVPVADTDNPCNLLKGKALHPGSKSIAVEKSHLRFSQADELREAFPEASFTDIGRHISLLRNRKTAGEAAKIREAIRLIEDVLQEGLTRVKPGVTEIELVAELEYVMKKKGADFPAFSTMVLAGANSALPHGVPGMTTVQEGQFLLFDLGVFKNGYCSDITRTFVLGEPTAEMEKIYDTVLRAEEAAIQAVRTGRPLAEVDRAARELIAGEGYGPYFTHRTGHGMGLEVHEYPSVHGENQDPIVSGMVFTIEPGIYVPGVGGVRIEDDIFVTENGAEVLTSFPKNLTRL
ncbi:M24 family metallopeptidase [Aneurinibacillus tyrosinisolvens]|uniref:M24 family metallopeptidase n=1 Tax=Aneurinibacillus tyrosinisolvens TaxID=1443435 RepID=UPI00063EF396|nr:Xaa-Pro peptidase family protein [Aneurinibacillus tyrosinisolvens]